VATIERVTTCASCGTHNPDGFKFCGNCSASLTAAATTREQRKTVTIVFCDVTGSTSLGERTDPEALRALLARYFDRMKSVVEAHGGTVEKFIGDAVMAVFGVPHVHEDDALRAVRAAVEMRDELPALGIQARIGINTGEVVTGTTERLATGDAVNVAARLQQAAAAQEILIGEQTFALVANVIDADQVAPLVLKGKDQPVLAFRLQRVTGTPMRRNETSMIGRETELRRLRDAYDQAIGNRSCQLFTVLGNAGVGKSRLSAEFLAPLHATVVRGACVSYGDGITYLPVIEVIDQLREIQPGLSLDEDLSSLLGQESFTAPSEQIAWAFRRLLEETAQEKPLVVLLDDLQWAEGKLLDLVEHVADLSRDAPILLLCMARPDLLDRRPTWAGGKLNATNLLLEPLSGAESAEMVGLLVGGLSERVRERVVRAAEGNPLFVEEMAALVRESGDENVRVPPTIHALLAARLDQLEDDERGVLERGAIEGRLFHRGSIEALYPEESDVATRLVALVRKDLVRPDKAEVPGEQAFRFRHLLIRDAAYDSLPKSSRADMHERFAGWLERAGASLPELDEILGYHLEQACRYRLELGQELDDQLALQARDRLAAAGRRAYQRGDFSAAANLLGRADQMPGAPNVALQMDAVIATFFGVDGASATRLAEAHIERSGSDRAVELCSRIELEFLSTFVDPTGASERLRALVDEASALFEDSDNLPGMYVVYQAQVDLANMRSDVAAVMKSLDAATAVSRQLGLGNEFIPQRAGFRIASDEPNSQSLAWFATEVAGNHIGVDEHRAEALAMAGRFDDARKMIAEELKHARALGGAFAIGNCLGFASVRVETHAGDFEAAAGDGEKGVALLLEVGNASLASTAAAYTARANFYAGAPDKAQRWAERAKELAAPDDLLTQLVVAQTMVLVLAQRGLGEEAEREASAAIALARSTHTHVLLGDALFDKGTAYALLGKAEDAAVAYRGALALYVAKENVALAERTRQKLAELEDHSAG
jgi:class 3 adenylate cyclase/tetratricopeptide (TPR) repeat protein